MSILLVILALVVTVSGTSAQVAQQTPQETVATFHQALVDGEKAQALALLASDIVIFESGGAELSRQEYASHHLPADMAFSAATQRKVIDQQGQESEDIAWQLTRFETTGVYKKRQINSHGVETMLLRRTQDGWLIMHIHWSSRSKAD